MRKKLINLLKPSQFHNRTSKNKNVISPKTKQAKHQIFTQPRLLEREYKYGKKKGKKGSLTLMTFKNLSVLLQDLVIK